MIADRPTILYVEDEPNSRRVLQMIIRDMGLSNLFMFDDSCDFLARIEALDDIPDVIFLDVHVKPYDGFEMLKMLRQLRKFDDVPIVAMTASVMGEEVQQLRMAGFSGCLAKPLDMDTFPDVLNRIVHGESVWRIVE